jgi:sphingomyelin phosphodiesterase acid-like 3
LKSRKSSVGARLGLAAALALHLARAASGEEPAPTPVVAGQVIMMSDLHFDPMADPRLVGELAASEPDEWRAVLERSDDQSLGRYGRDSNWLLLRSAFRQMKEVLPDPVFVLIPGDFLAHDFRREFDAAASEHSNAAYRAFVRKTMQFLAQQIEQTFPATSILPTLGNNDDVCGDYQLQPGGPFLADTLVILHTLVGGGGTGFDQDWTSFGNYSIKVGGIRVLSTNTNFFSVHYRNSCGSSADPDPGRATLAWLEGELAAAKQAQEHVWLVYHIPPGMDGYATLRRGACPGTIIPMWAEAYAEPFYRLLRRYTETVAASFAGHTHMDDFRLIGDADGYFAFTLITPAVSPIFGQNPAFRILDYDSGGSVLDQTTFDLANLQEATAAGGGRALWQEEYSFTRQWHLPRVDRPSLDSLYLATENAPDERERWHVLFPVSSPVYWPQLSSAGVDGAQAVRAFRCASGNVLSANYQQCYCRGGH